MTIRIGIDAPNVSRDEALEFMVHHLQLAAMYFEATTEMSLPALQTELIRIIADDNRALDPAIAFTNTIHEFYERLEDED